MPKKVKKPARALMGRENLRKCHPKLRMLADASPQVLTISAEQVGSISVQSQKLLRETPRVLGDDAVPKPRRELKAKRGKLARLADNVLASVFIETRDAGAHKRPFAGEKARKSNLVTATVPFSKLRDIAAKDEVTYIELGEPLATPTPIISADKVGPPQRRPERFGPAEAHGDGEGVLIGIIDVQGFDFSHPDFLDGNGRTRFVRIWDQGGDARPHPKGGKQFERGAEFRQEHLNAAITASRKLKVPAYELEPQSQRAVASHGTHVASIAAGNTGVCPRAKMAGVLISLPDITLRNGELDPRKSFYDSTSVAHAVDYLVSVADELKMPLSINVSLGTNGHAHDASSAVSRWIDAAIATPGRCISVAAGNAGQEVAQFEGDTGYTMGRIHTSGIVPARGLTADIEWIVMGNGIADISANELEIWYSPQDRFEVWVRPPDSADWIGPVAPGQFIENRELPAGCFLSVYNELYHPANGANYIAVHLAPFRSKEGLAGIPAGRWTVRLHGSEVRDGRFHGWIERDDPRPQGRVGDREAWRFPSFFSERSNVDNTSVSSLACGQRVISVANLDEAAERVNVSSSQGPTRDGRFKPDTAAPGTRVVAAKGFAGPDDLWVAMTGTSMASPFVAGVAGLMLGVNPKLTAAQIEGIIARTALPLPGADFKWANDAGFGRINPEACVREVGLVNARDDITDR